MKRVAEHGSGSLLSRIEGVAYLVQPPYEQRLHQQAVVRLSPIGDDRISECLVHAPPDVPPDERPRHHALGVVPERFRVFGAVAPASPGRPLGNPAGKLGHPARWVHRGGKSGSLGSCGRLLVGAFFGPEVFLFGEPPEPVATGSPLRHAPPPLPAARRSGVLSSLTHSTSSSPIRS